MQDTISEQRKELTRLRAVLAEIVEVVDDYVDIDNNGGPNMAMRVLTLINEVLEGVIRKEHIDDIPS